jgi:hypothetical protein
VVALAQQLVALNTTLCGASSGAGGGSGGSALISTVPVLAQLDAAWEMMGALFQLAAALQLERNDLMRVAQAGSLLFGAGQQALAARLAAVRSLQATEDLSVTLGRSEDSQLTVASEGRVLNSS